MKTLSAVEKRRIEVRVSSEFETLFSRAAEIAGVSLSAFITESARERAMAIIEQHERIVLNNKARDMLLKAMTGHSSHAKTLERAANRYALK